MGVAWGKILPRQGVSGGKNPPRKPTSFLVRKTHFFVLKRVAMAFMN